MIVSWQLNWVFAFSFTGNQPSWNRIDANIFILLGQFVSSPLAAVLELSLIFKFLHCGAVHPGKIGMDQRYIFFFCKVQENYLWKGDGKREQKQFFHY